MVTKRLEYDIKNLSKFDIIIFEMIITILWITADEYV